MSDFKTHIRGRLDGKTPNPVDVHVGHRIKIRRQMLDMSQKDLGDILGLTFQQIQKYEKGANRIGASRLFDISCVLGVSIDFFFCGMDETIISQSPYHLHGQIANVIPFLARDPMQNPETVELVHAYYRIKNHSAAKHLLQALKLISTPDSEHP